jgi:hypothetical protein
MFRHLALMCCFTAALVCAPQLWAAEGFDLATADWSVTSPNNLAVKPPTDDMGGAVFALVKKRDPQLARDYPDLCSSNPWEFADLHRSGTLSLVVALSDGRFCGQNLIIDKTASGFRDYASSSPLSSRFSGPQVEDLSGKGDFVVIEPTDFTDFNGMNTRPCIADFPVIYRWTGDGYANVSNQYKQYYEKQIASLKAQIDAAEAPPAATSSTQVSEPRVIPRSKSWRQSTDGSDGAAKSFVQANAPFVNHNRRLLLAPLLRPTHARRRKWQRWSGSLGSIRMPGWKMQSNGRAAATPTSGYSGLRS